MTRFNVHGSKSREIRTPESKVTPDLRKTSPTGWPSNVARSAMWKRFGGSAGDEPKVRVSHPKRGRHSPRCRSGVGEYAPGFGN